MTRKHQHSQGDRYEYQKLSFWMKPENHFLREESLFNICRGMYDAQLKIQ